MTDWTPLNAKTSERWLRCETGRGHRYTDETIWRWMDGFHGELHVCQKCRVPAVLIEHRLSGFVAAKSAARRRKERAA